MTCYHPKHFWATFAQAWPCFQGIQALPQPESVVRHWPGYPGELFLNALQELVLPLIALALLNGVLSLRHSTAGCPPGPNEA